MNDLERILEKTLVDFHNEEDLFASYLALGCDIFGLTTGIISHVEGNQYGVRKLKTTLEGLNEGDVFELKDTYCRQVVEQNKTVLFNSAGELDEYRKHPVYQNMKLESYISAPIQVHGKIYGTINFSDQDIVTTTDSADNQRKIQYLALGIGRKLESKQLKDQVNKTFKILNETGSIAKVGGWEMDVATGELTWTDETFNILEVEKRQGQKPMLEEGLQLFADEHVPVITQAVGDAVEHGKPYSLELKAKTAKGNIKWVYTSGKANRENGKIVTLSGTIQDIDAKKATEIRLEQERIQNIQNAKLASLGAMSAGVAHEINNPLAIISGSASMLAVAELDQEKREKTVQKVKVAVKRISKIVNGLKKFSRSSNQIKLEQVSLLHLCRESMDLVETKSKRDEVPIKCLITEDQEIFVDEVQIEQILVNLFNNAIDSCSACADPWIEVSHQEANNMREIIVRDCGKGIESAKVQKLFDPFFTTKDVGKGTGLGLSISKGIAKEHGGDLAYRLIDGHTAFVLSLPKSKAS